jgi:hypothetical protein
MWLTGVFGNLEALESAGIEDVAFLALQQAKASEHFVPGNIIGSVTDNQLPTSFGLTPQAQRARIKVILSEAFAWLEAEGLIVKDFSEHNASRYLVSRR